MPRGYLVAAFMAAVRLVLALISLKLAPITLIYRDVRTENLAILDNAGHCDSVIIRDI